MSRGCYAFRAYALAYIKANPGVQQALTQMVRKLQPGAHGAPRNRVSTVLKFAYRLRKYYTPW